jgi:uncharacterized membrane protein
METLLAVQIAGGLAVITVPHGAVPAVCAAIAAADLGHCSNLLSTSITPAQASRNMMPITRISKEQ